MVCNAPLTDDSWNLLPSWTWHLSPSSSEGLAMLWQGTWHSRLPLFIVLQAAIETESLTSPAFPHWDTEQSAGGRPQGSGLVWQSSYIIDHLPRSDVVIDVKICATVNGAGDWKAQFNANNTKLLNPTLTQAESAKYTKHERNYASVGMAFVPFVLGCFGDIGVGAARFLYALAFLELRQNDDMLDKAGLPTLPPTDRSQFRALCFRQSLTRISAALAKATVILRVLQVCLPVRSFRISI